MDEASTAPSRRRYRRGITCALGLALAGTTALVSSCGPGTAADPGKGPLDLRIADSYAPTHPISAYGTQTFIDEIETAGNGADDVEYFPAGQMGTARDLAHLTKKSVLDIAPASPAYLEDELPLSSVSDLPNMTQDACVAAESMMELLGEGGVLYEAEYEPQGLRPLWIAIIPGYEVMTGDSPVESPADVRGQVLRSAGGAFDVTIEAIGASAVSMPAADTYEAMARGTIDGTPMPYVSAVSYNLEEVAQYSTEGLNLGSVGIPYVISETTWQGLSAAEQAQVEEAATAANRELCEGLNRDKDESRQIIADEGMVFAPIEGELAQEWDSVLADVRSDWASSLDAIDLPGSEVLDAYEKAVASRER